MSNKSKRIISAIGVIFSLSLLVISSILTEEKIINPASASTLTVFSVILVLISVFYACRYDYKTSIYKCRKCGHTFKPTFKAYVWGPHTLTTRHLKCPVCKEKSWCKRKWHNQKGNLR